MSDCPDVAIIGAGFAGLAAAAELQAHDFSVELFEATQRVGGRAHTVHDEVELGPEFIHGCPDATLALVRAAGLEIERITDTHHMSRDGHIVELPAVWERFGRLLEPATRPGAIDESARAYLERSRMSPDDARLFASLVEGFYAAPLDDIGIRGIADDAGGAAGVHGAQQARIRGGYGRLVAVLERQLAAASVPIHFGHVVHAIDYSTDRVRIDHTHGSSLARRVIVTLPVGVLQAGDVRFQPALDEHAAALAQLAMGQVVKVVLCLREPVWRHHGPRHLAFIHRDQGAFPAFWLHSSARHQQLTAWAGGPHARALATYTIDDLVDRVIDEFAGTLALRRTTLVDAVVHEHYHDYARDPFAYGAYSYTRVDGSGAADVLARPLASRLYFAGEATDAEYEGSVAGAIASGQRAAKQVIAAATTSVRTVHAEANAFIGHT